MHFMNFKAALLFLGSCTASVHGARTDDMDVMEMSASEEEQKKEFGGGRPEAEWDVKDHTEAANYHTAKYEEHKGKLEKAKTPIGKKYEEHKGKLEKAKTP